MRIDEFVPYPMAPADLARVGAWLYGHPTRWQTKMARDLLAGVGTVANWAAGRSDVPGPAVAALRLMAARSGKPLPARDGLEDLL